MENFLNKQIYKQNIKVVQINIGDKCDHACTHCHVGASPSGDKNMKMQTAEHVVGKLKTMDIKTVEFTGGTPEMNECLPYFIESLSSKFDLVVRSSLTVLTMDEYKHLPEFFKKHNVTVIGSVPAVFKESTDRQRGKGTFDLSIKALKRLNELGYGNGGAKLDLVYNPGGDYLPSPQAGLERDYKKILAEQYDVQFNNLLAITNVPLKRFRDDLDKKGKLDDYMELLKENYNSEAVSQVMCKSYLSVGYDGSVYDCDFNLASCLPLKGYEKSKFWDIDFDNFKPEITLEDYCYACVAGGGSSCGGELVEVVKQYYGDELERSEDLKTDACCTVEEIPKHILEVLPYVADEVVSRYYGCGSPIPACLEGLTTLDLGCGTGRDSYVMSKLVGEDGFVNGIDMTANQIEVAKRYIDEQTERFGFKKPNVNFVFDYIENIDKHFDPESMDIVTSNCVINLIKKKEEVIRKVYDLLKEGGEMYFSDIYADRRLPEEIRDNPILYGECLGGALYYKDFERIARKVGFIDPRTITKRVVEIKNKEIEEIVGNAKFYSITYRLWKIDGLEDDCEDYGHFAVYRGGAKEFPFKFTLDDGHVFEKNRPEKVCGNTAKMLSETKFAKYFEVFGNFDEHFGAFVDCETSNSEDDDEVLSCGC
jgi:radical SAM/Cys-rich protein